MLNKTLLYVDQGFNLLLLPVYVIICLGAHTKDAIKCTIRDTIETYKGNQRQFNTRKSLIDGK